MKNNLILSNISIIEAMKKLDAIEEKCLVVVDEKNKLLGTVTDGDIRRSILNGNNFSKSINDTFNKNPIKIYLEHFSEDVAVEIIENNNIDLIPIIDKNEIVKRIFNKSSLAKKVTNKIDNISVVIMAGGKGTRMEPFTKVLPKPLVPVHEKPIIEHIIEKFTDFGIKQFYMTVNYKSKILKSYFEELQPNYEISFVDESEPLGTAGSLKFLENKFIEPFFVTNCDILVQGDYSKIYDFHLQGSFDVTLVASTKEFVVPYGACELDENGHLFKINEKPKYDFLINTGLYILNPDIIELIPKDRFFHITHLIQKVKDNGKKVGVFPIADHSWIDIGQWSEYKKALELI